MAIMWGVVYTGFAVRSEFGETGAGRQRSGEES